jgi:hypothetical protein
MQEQLSQSMPMLCEHVKTKSVAPMLVDSNYARAQQWREEFCNCVTVQHFQNADIQASGTLQLPDQNIIFDQITPRVDMISETMKSIFHNFPGMGLACKEKVSQWPQIWLYLVSAHSG